MTLSDELITAFLREISSNYSGILDLNYNGSNDDPCNNLVPKHELIAARFFLLSVIGTCVALFGIFGNLTTFVVMTRPSMRQSSNNLYLGTLAIFDTLVLLPSMMLYSLEHVSEYFDDSDLYVVWIQWVPHCFALSHFAQTGSVYITVVATFERYLAVLYPRYQELLCTKHRAFLVIGIVFVFAAFFNCTKFFEIVVARHENCTGFAAYELVPSALLKDDVYSMVYTLWLSQFVMVFLPFGILLAVNTVIVWNFRRSLKRFDCWDVQKRMSFRRFDGSEMILERAVLKEQSRDATRVLATIVIVFLICNCLGFIVTLLEGIYNSYRLSEWWPNLYACSRDVINFLAIVNSSINFVICCTFGEDFRCELAAIYGCKERRRQLQSRRRRQFVGSPRGMRRKVKRKANANGTGSKSRKTIVELLSDETTPSESSPLQQRCDVSDSLTTLYRTQNENRPCMFERFL